MSRHLLTGRKYVCCSHIMSRNFSDSYCSSYYLSPSEEALLGERRLFLDPGVALCGSLPGGSIVPVDLPMELWVQSMLELVHDPTLSPKESAASRGAVATVCKDWHECVYTTSTFWSNIVIFKDLNFDRLRFVISKCAVGDVHIRLHLHNIRVIRGIPATIWVIALLVDRIFGCIADCAERWKTFELCTENPAIFHRVQSHCRSLDVTSLETLDLSYVYIPGHSPHIRAAEMYNVPFRSEPWFGEPLPRLSTLRLFCTPILWGTSGLFDHLQVVELSDVSCTMSLHPDVLPAIFEFSVQLHILRIGMMRAFEIPSHFVLSSSSLETLDVDFFNPAFIGRILESVVAPGLTELVVRGVFDNVDLLVACPQLLSGVTLTSETAPLASGTPTAHGLIRAPLSNFPIPPPILTL
ncbi:hypothetical protein B0H14DRAFT_3448809 [Mycena olivaceomarginata]|nr:hypothetical protein B0H14DRAFT_3448809 [Mycena olivaceomarginata]